MVRVDVDRRTVTGRRTDELTLPLGFDLVLTRLPTSRTLVSVNRSSRLSPAPPYSLVPVRRPRRVGPVETGISSHRDNHISLDHLLVSLNRLDLTGMSGRRICLR